MKRWIFFFYTSAYRNPEVVNSEKEMLNLVVELTKKRTKFAIYLVGECVGDFS